MEIVNRKNLNPQDQDAISCTLNQYWGFTSLREHQVGPIESLISGKDVVAVLPTGGGKSLCYQLPGLVRGGLTLVISPLVALMKDQVDDLKSRGVKAYHLAGLGDRNDVERVLNNVEFSGASFLFLSPERLNSEIVQSRINRLNVKTIAIDEAHCISEWGHDFRPDYRLIQSIRPLLKHAAWGCFTATATREVIDDIQKVLGLKDAKAFTTPMTRLNLHYSVCRIKDSDGLLFSAVMNSIGSGIIYVRTRLEAEMWSKRLTNIKGGIRSYHAGLSTDIRNERQSQWIRGDIRVIVSTNAFGMGIDKPDVRWVYHAHLPPNLESYVQEAGRAGRDGKASQCILFLDDQKIDQGSRLVQKSRPNPDWIKSLYQHIANQSITTVGDLPLRYFPIDLKPWSMVNGADAFETHQVLSLLCQAGYLKSKKTKRPVQFRIKIQKNGLQFSGQLDTPLVQYLGKHNAANELVVIDEKTLNELGYSKASCETELNQYQNWGWIDFEIDEEIVNVAFLRPRESASNVLIPEAIGSRPFNQRLVKWDAIREYVEKPNCRQQMINEYFQFENTLECGNCDVCKSKKIKDLWEDLMSQIPDSGIDWKHWQSQQKPKDLALFIKAVKSGYDQADIYFSRGFVYRINA
ncbi:MAG: RecQ family ATP-dependent DNA helicase [Flavobacteriales bacterium]